MTFVFRIKKWRFAHRIVVIIINNNSNKATAVATCWLIQHMFSITWLKTQVCYAAGCAARFSHIRKTRRSMLCGMFRSSVDSLTLLSVHRMHLCNTVVFIWSSCEPHAVCLNVLLCKFVNGTLKLNVTRFRLAYSQHTLAPRSFTHFNFIIAYCIKHYSTTDRCF